MVLREMAPLFFFIMLGIGSTNFSISLEWQVVGCGQRKRVMSEVVMIGEKRVEISKCRESESNTDSFTFQLSSCP
jgi:hypothetical protein